MGKRRPERDLVEIAIRKDPKRKAHEIAEEVGLLKDMDYDRAVDYVKNVKRTMKAKGEITAGVFATDEERLEDITTLFELRKGQASDQATYFMLLLNCYYRLRSKDDDVHMTAIDDTYDKNNEMVVPLHMSRAIRICEIALARYMQSIDEAQCRAARKRGLPGAGLNYNNHGLIEKLEITDEELQYLKSIKKE